MNNRLIVKQIRIVREFSLWLLNGKTVYGLCHRIFMGHFRESTSRFEHRLSKQRLMEGFRG